MKSKIPEKEGSSNVDKNKGGRPSKVSTPTAKEICFGCRNKFAKRCRKCEKKAICQRETDRIDTLLRIKNECNIGDYDPSSPKCKVCIYNINCRQRSKRNFIKLALAIVDFNTPFLNRKTIIRELRRKSRYKTSKFFKNYIMLLTREFIDYCIETVNRTMDKINEKKRGTGILSHKNSRFRRTLMFRDLHLYNELLGDFVLSNL